MGEFPTSTALGQRMERFDQGTLTFVNALVYLTPWKYYCLRAGPWQCHRYFIFLTKTANANQME
jgi:hypothetical protein